jgi:glc operon protein GlcG
MRMKPSLQCEEAAAIAAACQARAHVLGSAVSIAVVDEAGALLHFRRMDGARAYSVDLAIRKGRTAAAVCVSTRVLEAMFRKRPMHGQDVLAVAGGLPVMSDGQCAGAIGVSGATAEDDEAIAAAGFDRLAMSSAT